MPLRNRNELKSFFQASRKLSAADFAELIESMLNKRDDQFHGIWKAGQTYRQNDVVIYDSELWQMIAEGEICSKNAPPSNQNPQWKSLTIEDDDWEVVPNDNVMWAKVFDRVGIGIGSHQDNAGGQSEYPAARLDVQKVGQGRWLLFPQGAEQTQFTLLHYEPNDERSYLVTGLSLAEVNLLTDAAQGFVFRKGGALAADAKVTELRPTEGQVLMVIKPKQTQGGAELARLGLNVADPTAMLEITDGQRGTLLFTPDEKSDPVLSIVNLDPQCQQNYIALGVGKDEATIVSDAPSGVVFRHGQEYPKFRGEPSLDRGNQLMTIRQHPDRLRPQVGIGTGDRPLQAILDLQDGSETQVQILPELPPTGKATSGDSAPVISIINLQPPTQKTYLTSGLGSQVAGWASNAKHGFVFRQGGALSDAAPQDIDGGDIHLAIREDGHIGMGTADPISNLDIVNRTKSGQFLFNLDDKVNPALGILNLRPDTKNNYFTLGADNNNAVLITDSQYGFLFKCGEEFGTNNSQVDINQGLTLLSIRSEVKGQDEEPIGVASIRPDGKGKLGIGKRPIDYDLDVRGIARTFTIYQDTNSDLINKKQSLTCVLTKINQLRPIIFEWKNKRDVENAGDQLGLLAHEVDEVFPQVVKTSSDGTQAIAYQNLVPVLIQGIKELIETKDATQAQLDIIRIEFEQFKQDTDKRLKSLESRG
jgi:Chaperone of endosialidase